MIPARALWAVFAVSLVGCGALSPPPGDNFYRLSIETPPTSAQLATARGATFVAPFSASGLHSERALIYAHADGTTLEQSSYHFWIDSPRRLLQLALADYLQHSAGISVVADAADDAEREIRGRIVKFERQAGEGGDQAVAVLNFEVFERPARAPALSRRYVRSIPVDGDSMAVTAAALNGATAEIFAELLGDLRQLH